MSDDAHSQSRRGEEGDASMQATPAAVGPLAVEVKNLRKRYGSTVAVDDVSLAVREGEIFGVVGPNGAGKTTTIECVVGLRSPDAGTVRVFGLDPQRDRAALHAIVGVQLQSASLPDVLKVSEVFDMYRSFYPEPSEDDLIEALGLGDKRHSYCRSLSGGQKQRLSAALALVGQPRLAVLDEMTTGLDPQARRDTWDVIKGIRDRGRTVLLITHFMEEAERLCDRVAIVDRGRVVAVDTPEGLAGQSAGSRRLRFVPSGPFDDQLLTALPETQRVEHEGAHVVVTGSGDLVSVVAMALAKAGISAKDMALESASLEDAFLRLTGHHLGAEPQEGSR